MKQSTQETFPLIIKKGFAVVKIYEIKNRKRNNYTTYTVSYVGPNGRTRRDFADLNEAKTEANVIARSIAGFDAQRLNLTGDDARHYQEACDTIRPTGLPLHSVAHEFVRAFNILGGVHIVEAARYYKKHVDVDLPQIMVEDAVEKFYQAKKAEGLSPAYLKDILTLLGNAELRWKFARRKIGWKTRKPKESGFADDFQVSLASIQPEDLREYLNTGKRASIGLVAKENRRRLLVVLFNWAKSQGWLRKNEETAADALGTYKPKRRDVEIYTPAEMSKLLNAADWDFLPYIALIAFGGVRREELHKGLLWEAINFERGHIIVPAAIAKTGRKRKIVMHENLAQWLAPYRMKHGPIFNKDPRKRLAKVVRLSRVKWKRNALRHSFGSYRMEQTKNEGIVALEMGNSPKVVKDHYFEIVDEHAAREYWNLKPLPRDDRKIAAIAA
jgi:integrase